MNVGLRIKEARQGQRVPVTALAYRCGVSPAAIYRIESGDRAPSMALLEKIARELRVEPADLLKEPALPKVDAPPGAGVDHLRPISDSLEVSDEVEAEVRLERVRKLMASWGAGELSSVAADRAIEEVYAS
jgi:transcriptional regulator with XRE-family HTH domain